MSDPINPLVHPEHSAHEIVIELIRAGKIGTETQVTQAFTTVLDHYISELKRLKAMNLKQ